jgi:hypothetical protein
MKSFGLVLIVTLFISSVGAFASPEKFACSTQVISPNSAPVDCQMSVDPQDQSTITNRPGSIATDIFSGTLTVTCQGYAKSFSGVYPLWEQPTLASEAVSDAQHVASDPYTLSHFRPVTFDASDAASGATFAGGPNGSVLVFYVTELKDGSGKILGHNISSTLGYMVGCVQ